MLIMLINVNKTWNFMNNVNRVNNVEEEKKVILLEEMIRKYLLIN